MINDMNVLKKGAEDINISISEEAINDFGIYRDKLIEWNEKINITAITDTIEIQQKHFLDSLTPLTTGLFAGNKKIIDIGTGGGFPGLPLKIANNSLEVVLLDSLNKRINFLNEVIEVLRLNNIKAVHGRAEELSLKPAYREGFNIAISRAVASLNTLAEYCIPFVKVGGYFISMKGPQVEEEVNDSKNAIKILGARLSDIKYITIPDTDITHSLIILEKITETPAKYPRGGGKPRKNPL